MPLAAQYRGLSLGLGGEANAVLLDEGLGYGVLFAVENRFNRYLGLSFQGNATLQNKSTLDDIREGTAFIGVEAAAYLRFYFLSPKEMRQDGVEIFLGAGDGVLATMNGMDFHNSRGSPEAGGIFGMRFRLGSRFYLEPYIRAGYPFIGGAGVVAGFRFPARGEAAQILAAQIVEVEKIIETAAPPAEAEETDKPSIDDTFVIIFQANSAQFYNLDAAAILKNKETLLKVLKLLYENPDTWLIIEGYANPVLGTKTEERRMLMPLSEKRAAYIASALIAFGVSPDRLATIGSGGGYPVAAKEDRENWMQNRRVEMRFVR
jgi:outer membrane protein OmpA-like peptidoglycan-associated protein